MVNPWSPRLHGELGPQQAPPALCGLGDAGERLLAAQLGVAQDMRCLAPPWWLDTAMGVGMGIAMGVGMGIAMGVGMGIAMGVGMGIAMGNAGVPVSVAVNSVAVNSVAVCECGCVRVWL